jgi:uncharacterized cupin superfamily protein
MPLHLVKLQDIPAFDYQFGPVQGGRMQDVGRNVGSDRIGLVIQTVPPGKRASRRHRHMFQENCRRFRSRA